MNNTNLTIQLYHCKGSKTSTPGSRINDAYEVAGQVVKSSIWLKSLSYLKNRMINREDSGSIYLKGNRQELNRIIKEAKNFQSKFEIVLVQPGISQSKLQENVSTVLAAADRFIVESNHYCEKLVVWGSA